MTSYLTVARDASAEIEVKRSRFLCTLRRVGDEDAARAVVAEQRALHPGARHHCSAFVIGPRSIVPEDGEGIEASSVTAERILPTSADGPPGELEQDLQC